MKLELDEDQRLLSDSLQTWLRKEYGTAVWREIAGGGTGRSAEMWRQFAEMGWLAAGLPAEHGGLGGGALVTYVIAEAFGAALVLEPYLSTIVLGAGLIARAGSAAQIAEVLPRIAEGRWKTAFAFAEPGARFELGDVQTRAVKDGSDYLLTGRKIAVWDAPDANELIVLARTAGSRSDAKGLGLFLVAADAPGVRMTPFSMVDRRRGAHIDFERARGRALGDPDAALPVVQHVTDAALAYLAAEACGAMRAATAQTVAYLKERKQFGRPLADFQVLRHRVVDMTVKLECARSLAMHAAASAGVDAAPSRASALAAAAAKSNAGRVGRYVGHEAIQLHGGMGMTDDLAVGQYLKRIVMIDTAFGNADYQQQRFAALSSGS